MYGTQTIEVQHSVICAFENDVKMYGTQTSAAGMFGLLTFENDVKMYGTQTQNCPLERQLCV